MQNVSDISYTSYSQNSENLVTFKESGFTLPGIMIVERYDLDQNFSSIPHRRNPEYFDHIV